MFDFNFDWKKELNTNIDSIDNQHKQLFKIGRDIEQLIRTECIGVTQAQLLDIVCAMREYMGYHFYEEEKMMEKFNYSNIQNHKKEHKDFEKLITEVDLPKLSKNPQIELPILKDMIKDKVLSHLLGEDLIMAKQYMEYMKEKEQVPCDKPIVQDMYEEKYGKLIGDLDVSRVYFLSMQNPKGRVVLIYKEKVKDMSYLSSLERSMFCGDIQKVSKVLKKIFKPQAINYGEYGDIEERLHFHIVPKYFDDPSWGKTFEVNPIDSNLSDQEYNDYAIQLKKELSK